MRSAAAAVLLSAWLAACADRPPFAPDTGYSTPDERQMFQALKDVDATDKQRLAAMDAWDDVHPRLAALEDEAQSVAEDWSGLDRRDPAFQRKSTALARRAAELLHARMALAAKFEGKVAGILTADQWSRWQLKAMRPEERGPQRLRSSRRPQT